MTSLDLSLVDQIAHLDPGDPDLLAWLRAQPGASDGGTGAGGSIEQIWGSCKRADWLVWLTPAVGHDARSVLGAAVETTSLGVLARVPSGEKRPRQSLQAALAWLLGNGSAEACEQAARAGETAAREGTTYRTTPSPPYQAAVRASVWVARAAHAVATAEERSGAAGPLATRLAAAAMGTGPSALMAHSHTSSVKNWAGLSAYAQETERAAREEISFALAALSEAMRETAHALCDDPESAGALEHAHAQCADRFRQVLADAPDKVGLLAAASRVVAME